MEHIVITMERVFVPKLAPIKLSRAKVASSAMIKRFAGSDAEDSVRHKNLLDTLRYN